MFEKTGGAIKNGQSSDTGNNIEYTRHRKLKPWAAHTQLNTWGEPRCSRKVSVTIHTYDNTPTVLLIFTFKSCNSLARDREGKKYI